ncbi:hypothetical protein [Mesorhizobium sp. BHbdii]
MRLQVSSTAPRFATEIMRDGMTEILIPVSTEHIYLPEADPKHFYFGQIAG